MTAEPTLIASGLGFPEGPVWMPDGTLLCVELKNRRVDRIHPDGRIEVVAEPGGSPNGLAIGPDGAAYVCNSGGWGFHEIMGVTVTEMLQPDDYSGGRIERVDLDTGEVTVLHTGCDGIIAANGPGPIPASSTMRTPLSGPATCPLLRARRGDRPEGSNPRSGIDGVRS